MSIASDSIWHERRKTAMARALRLLISLALIPAFAAPATQHTSHPHGSMPADASYWEGLMESMARMDAAMSSTRPSANADTDFVALMLPHHQAAIDMAKIELTFGKDEQLRRLAQEIVTDQESEIQLMKLWRQQYTCDGKSSRKPCTDQRKEW
jgi:uncharacterized protein (DUF305 family)